VGDAAYVHELHEDVAVPVMDGIGDRAPALDLLLVVQAGRVQVTLADGARLSALGDDQPDAGALPVVLRGDVARHLSGACAVAGQRSHHDPVGKGHLADLDRLEQSSHSVHLMC